MSVIDSRQSEFLGFGISPFFFQASTVDCEAALLTLAIALVNLHHLQSQPRGAANEPKASIRLRLGFRNPASFVFK